MKKWMALLMSVLALGLVAAGCGDDDDDDDGGAAETTEQPAPADTGPADTAPAGGELELTASETEISWEPNELSAAAGAVTITLNNPSPQIPHNVTIEGVDEGASETVMNDTTSVTTELEAGEYTYFCSVGDHRQQGMEGTLTVE